MLDHPEYPRVETGAPKHARTGWIWLSPLFIALFAAYLNIVVFGFTYGTGNQEFELPYVNWLRHRSLYPGDPIRAMFARFPTVFWSAIANLSNVLGVHNALFAAFLVTKLIFFIGVAAILRSTVKSRLLAWLIASGLALSPLLNGGTPFGASDILDKVQTQTSLGVALLVCACWGLIEKKWRVVAGTVGAAIFVDSLFAFYFVVPLAIFAVIDWRSRKRDVVLAGIFIAVVALIYLAFYAGRLPAAFPADYVQIIVWRDALHWNLSSHPRSEVLRGAGILLAAILAAVVARRHKIPCLTRLEILTASFALIVGLGIIAGKFFLRPSIILTQPLRADSFLFLLALIVIEAYAANLLLESTDTPAVWAFGILALLLPLLEYEDLLICLFLCAVVALASDTVLPSKHFQRWFAAAAAILLAGVFQYMNWSPLRISFVLGLAAIPFLPFIRATARMAACIVGLSCFLITWQMVPSVSRLWNPENSIGSVQVSWREVQEWAKADTGIDAKFLVPPADSGFRDFSDRSIWVDWKDGTAIGFSDPDLLPVWVSRMVAIDCGPEPGEDIWQSMDNYTREPLRKLEAVARANGIAYIVQTRNAKYTEPAIYANNDFVVYRVNGTHQPPIGVHKALIGSR